MNSFLEDFTEKHYREILDVASSVAPFIGYDEISSNQKFILWRHDCDFSLNRSLKLAEIENEYKVKSTYFINPHCEGYNIYEKSQYNILKAIINLGHDIGLHFDAGFYDDITEINLEQKVANEAKLLENLLSVDVKVFSFHNPTVKGLSWIKPTYGGLINCYATFFHNQVAYCSDSNGYWRHNRLFDFLSTTQCDKIQILTHAEWWQKKPMHARDRVFRCINDRAKNNLKIYDDFLEFYQRDNQFGSSLHIQSLRNIDSKEFQLLDYLLNNGYEELAIEELKSFFYSKILDDRLLITEETKTDYTFIKSLFEARCIKLPKKITDNHNLINEVFLNSLIKNGQLTNQNKNIALSLLVQLILLIHVPNTSNTL
jgi:hypothetical protein